MLVLVSYVPKTVSLDAYGCEAINTATQVVLGSAAQVYTPGCFRRDTTATVYNTGIVKDTNASWYFGENDAVVISPLPTSLGINMAISKGFSITFGYKKIDSTAVRWTQIIRLQTASSCRIHLWGNDQYVMLTYTKGTTNVVNTNTVALPEAFGGPANWHMVTITFEVFVDAPTMMMVCWTLDTNSNWCTVETTPWSDFCSCVSSSQLIIGANSAITPAPTTVWLANGVFPRPNYTGASIRDVMLYDHSLTTAELSQLAAYNVDRYSTSTKWCIAIKTATQVVLGASARVYYPGMNCSLALCILCLTVET
jgi:hypothetical protein